MSLRLRLTLIAAVAVALTVGITAAAAYVAVRSSLLRDVDRSLDRAVPEALRSLRRGGSGPGRPDRLFVGPRSFLVQAVTADGEVFAAPGQASALPVSETTRAVARGDAPVESVDTRIEGERYRVRTIPLQGGALQIGRQTEEIYEQLGDLALILALVGLGGIVLAGGVGAAVAGTALRPVARVTARMERLAGSGTLERLHVEGTDELGRLAAAFNSTLDALHGSVEAQRHLVADASHELRTPLTSLRTNIQILARRDGLSEAERTELASDVAEQLDELTLLVGDVVELARGQEAPAEVEDVRLDEIARLAAERTRRHAPAVRIDAQLTPVVVQGVPERLHRAVSNLLDNAAKWNRADAPVELTVADGEVRVRDHGPGFDGSDLPHVFDRFYRSEHARELPGSGLGLAIVKQIAESHGGSVHAENAPGGGALLRLRLPTVALVDDPRAVSGS